MPFLTGWGWLDDSNDTIISYHNEFEGFGDESSMELLEFGFDKTQPHKTNL